MRISPQPVENPESFLQVPSSAGSTAERTSMDVVVDGLITLKQRIMEELPVQLQNLLGEGLEPAEGRSLGERATFDFSSMGLRDAIILAGSGLAGFAGATCIDKYTPDKKMTKLTSIDQITGLIQDAKFEKMGATDLHGQKL